jgi:MOSC domain-containing protein YiiM
MRGTIVSINTAREGGLPKRARVGGAKLGEWGFEGDYHNRQMRPSFSKPGTLKPNIDRHISLVSSEVIDALNQELGLGLMHGSLGENITTSGLGDLSQIPDGARLVIRNSITLNELAVLRVVEQNKPCKNLYPLHRLLVKKIFGRRGILCAVESSTGHRLARGDIIEVFL